MQQRLHLNIHGSALVLSAFLLGVPVARAAPQEATRTISAAESSAPTDGFRIAVLPFDPSGVEPALEWLSEGTAWLLSEALTVHGWTVVPRRERQLALGALGLTDPRATGRADAVRLARRLGASQVVLGRVWVQEGRLVLEARILDLAQGVLGDPQQTSGAAGDLFEGVRRLADTLYPGAEAGEVSWQPYPSAEAFEFYIKGMTVSDPDRRQLYLRAALERVPEFARARFALWELYEACLDHQAAREAVLAVPESSSARRDAQFLAALSEIELGQIGLATVRLEVLRRQASDPALTNNLGVVELRSETGDPAGAADWFRAAVREDLGRADYRFNLGLALWRSGDGEGAVVALRGAVQLAPDDVGARAFLVEVLEATGRGVEAEPDRALLRRIGLDGSVGGLPEGRVDGGPVVEALQSMGAPVPPAPAPLPTAP